MKFLGSVVLTEQAQFQTQILTGGHCQPGGVYKEGAGSGQLTCYFRLFQNIFVLWMMNH